MRVAQKIGTNGSLKWIQRAVKYRPDLLLSKGFADIEWLSPLQVDGFAEYRDGAFLNRIGHGNLAAGLAAFWPRRGPQWDALGRSGETIFLVEAKAYLREVASPPSAASETSLRIIKDAFAAVKSDLGVDESRDWTRIYYQYANRLAHLWWLRQKGVEAKLLFVSFLGDKSMGGPSEATVWDIAFRGASAALGLPERHGISDHVMHVHPDVVHLERGVVE